VKTALAKLALTCSALACLSPIRAQDLRFTTARPTLNGFYLQWSNSVADQAFTLQGRDRLANTIWLPLQSPQQPWPTIQTQWYDPIFSTQLMRFYRVVAVQPAVRGELISATLSTNFSAFTLNLFYSLNGIKLTALYGVNCYKVVYETIDPLGGRTLASGGLYLPQQTGVSWPLLSFSHGTVTQTNDVPSVSLTLDAFSGVAFASVGYVSVVADLLGLGSSPGLHPFLHASSEATASVDMLRAARAYCASNNISLNGQLFLAGYSQGGHTELALHRELEMYHTNEFSVTASAPMAGPYDLSGVELNDMLSPRCPPNPYYIAYVLVAYQSVYDLAPSWSDLVVPPYDTNLPPLFNGNTAGSNINQALPACNISSIFTPAVLSSLTNDPGSPVYLALRANDLYRWKPLAPVRLYHCSGDLDVLPANSQVAYSNFVALGATNVQVIDPSPGANHSGCAIPALEAAEGWFNMLKH
jgi:hypothetical protein